MLDIEDQPHRDRAGVSLHAGRPRHARPVRRARPAARQPGAAGPGVPAKGWWHAYSDTIEPRFATYIGLESAASDIRIYETTLIPGLQTEASATLIMSAIKDQLAHRGQPSPLGSGSVCSTVSRDTARVSAT